MQCRNPRCDQLAISGQRWCQEHRDTLDRVRAELEADMARVRKGRSISRRCRADGCGEDKNRGSMFCDEHQYLEVE